MKKMEILVRILLALILVMAPLAGCASDGGTAPSTPAPPATGTEDTPADTAPEPPAGEDALPRVDLKMFFPGENFTEEDMAEVQAEINSYLLGLLNATLEINPVPWGSWDTLYPVMLAAGEHADLFFTASWNNHSVHAANGAFNELTDLLNTYGQGILSTIQDGYIDAAKISGQLFAIPQNKDMAQGYGLYVDKTVLSDAGYSVSDIKSLNDLTPVLAWVKENTDLVPFPVSLDVGGSYMSTAAAVSEGIADASKFEMGHDNWNGIIGFDVQSDKFVSMDPSNSQAWPAFAKLMKEWHGAGYFRPDFITDPSDQSMGMLADGSTWMTISSDAPGRLESIQQGSMNFNLDYIRLIAPLASTNSLTGSMTAIPIGSVDPARAMMVLDLLHTDAYLVNLINFGIEGKHYIQVGDGTITLPPGAGNRGDTGYGLDIWWEIGNAFLLKLWDTDLPDRWNVMKEFNANTRRSVILGFNFDAANVDTEMAGVNNVWEQFRPLIVTGQGDTEGFVTEMFDKMKAAGLDKIVEEYNSQYQAFKATR